MPARLHLLSETPRLRPTRLSRRTFAPRGHHGELHHPAKRSEGGKRE